MNKTYRNLILVVFCGAFLFLIGCDNATELAVQAARARIEYAIDNTRVYVDGEPDILANIRVGDGTTFEEIKIDLDFEYLISMIEHDDMFVARRYVNSIIEGLYNDLALMFHRTENLIIVESNVAMIDEIETPPEMEDITEFTINIGRFLRNPYKSLIIDTHYGELDITSEFFYGRTIIDGVPQVSETDIRLFFGYEEAEEAGDVVVTIATKNRVNTEFNVQNPGRSALITIPLNLDFMQDEQGRPLYNAVVFIDQDGVERGVLPRSFISRDNLYIYFNRTGTFRLTATPNGYTVNREQFLRDRGIYFAGSPDRYITRGEFYSALMHIHWVEDLHFDLPIHPFDDVDCPELELRLNVGQNLQVDVCPRSPYVLQGFPDRRFNPDGYLRRNHMIMMIAGNIEYFGFEIDGLMPAADNHIGLPSSPESGWYNHINYLIARNFVPYRISNGVHDIAPHENLTVGEAMEILFKLITTHHFVGR
ncbi:MAG: hypothetical protein FWC73_12010 [Defluviitaleaceae bacterium]|nr:hypothetical protein [Defluviitaleaceae bacterium]